MIKKEFSAEEMSAMMLALGGATLPFPSTSLS
jgi:hypothetical protein